MGASPILTRPSTEREVGPHDRNEANDTHDPKAPNDPKHTIPAEASTGLDPAVQLQFLSIFVRLT